MKTEPHIHVFWLYGVIAALAIREALATAAGPLLFDVSWGSFSFPWGPEAAQLVAILLLVSAFYFGSISYFTKTYPDGPQGEDQTRAYRVDVISGLFHYVIIFFWAFTLRFPETGDASSADAPIAFLFLFGWILLYDVVWWLMHKFAKGPKPELIAEWALKNFVILLFGAAAIMALHFLFGVTVRGATGITLVPVTLVLFWDFWNGAGNEQVGLRIGRR